MSEPLADTSIGPVSLHLHALKYGQRRRSQGQTVDIKARRVKRAIETVDDVAGGNDYWVWQRLDACSPRIVILEFNAAFGPDRAVTVPYDPAFDRATFASVTRANTTGRLWRHWHVLAVKKNIGWSWSNREGATPTFYGTTSDRTFRRSRPQPCIPTRPWIRSRCLTAWPKGDSRLSIWRVRRNKQRACSRPGEQ